MALAFVRLLALLYATAVALAAGWAWWVGIDMADSPRDHLLPGILLATLSAPMSFTMEPFFHRGPNNVFVQLAWLTICGAVQSALLFLFCAWLGKRSRRK